MVRGRPERVAEREQVRGLIRGQYGSAVEENAAGKDPITISTIQEKEERIYRC